MCAVVCSCVCVWLFFFLCVLFFFFVVLLFCFFFFFQAEDGIRDLVRSRGLGDVYKRQEFVGAAVAQARAAGLALWMEETGPTSCAGTNPTSVSYTHLTLPTSDLV